MIANELTEGDPSLRERRFLLGSFLYFATIARRWRLSQQFFASGNEAIVTFHHLLQCLGFFGCTKEHCHRLPYRMFIK